jgi:hypothetical protein
MTKLTQDELEAIAVTVAKKLTAANPGFVRMDLCKAIHTGLEKRLTLIVGLVLLVLAAVLGTYLKG